MQNSEPFDTGHRAGSNSLVGAREEPFEVRRRHVSPLYLNIERDH